MRLVELMRAKKAKGGSEPASPRKQALAEWLSLAAEEGQQNKGQASQYLSFLPIIHSMIHSMSDQDIDFLQAKLADLLDTLNAANTPTIETGSE